jgi:CO/xanthine dehydrogenase FAD-binding subunit
VIDLNRVEALRNIHVDHGGLTLGAMVRYAEVERSAEVAENWPLLSHAIGHIAHQQIRSRGTIGGSLAQNHPGAEMPLVLLCLDATLGVRSPEGTRTLPIDDFYTIDGKTTLGLRGVDQRRAADRADDPRTYTQGSKEAGEPDRLTGTLNGET